VKTEKLRNIFWGTEFWDLPLTTHKKLQLTLCSFGCGSLPAVLLDPEDGDSITSEASQKVLYIVTAVRASDPTQWNYFCKTRVRISEVLN
jgi:hypothetical protein